MIQPKHSTFNTSFTADNACKKAVLCVTTQKQKRYGAFRYWTII